MSDIEKFDATGHPIKLGDLYGYSVHSSGIGKVTIGRAIKLTKTGKVSLEVLDRKAFLYGEPSLGHPSSEIDVPNVAVFSHTLFKVDTFVPTTVPEDVMVKAKGLALDSHNNHTVTELEKSVEKVWDSLSIGMKQHFITKASRGW